MKSSLYFALAGYLLLAFATRVRPDSFVDDENTKWSEWKQFHGKSYADLYEENFRHAIWRYNLKKIESYNLDNLNFTVGRLNYWSDLTPIEFRFLMLQRSTRLDDRGSRNSIDIATLPPEVDWRKKGCVTPVINQGELSRSWAISAVESLQGQHCIATKQLKSLDIKKLARCCRSCFSVDDGFRYMIAHNRVDEDVNTETSRNDNCNFSKAAYGASMTGFIDLALGSEFALQQTVALVGPVSVTIDASHPSFQMYVSGVYDEPLCSSTRLDHSVLVVGYGTLDGQDYWLVKNSWGVNWGMKGYIMMTRNKDNQCGIASLASYPTGVTGELKF
ncbi:cathepsin L1-like [Dendronephthya gigantea]|uniref:cathepsin L1-like n=1 Tax=Dendronephthya gigantea TaxID=151771 RepID=UPI00106D80CE|nr:cathepsin L1-like [Dendronephthya gigantea]